MSAVFSTPFLTMSAPVWPEACSMRSSAGALDDDACWIAAVICSVPLLDMVRYHLSGEGRTWIPEYGSAEDAEQFKALYAYSPYHHVNEGTLYPALLMMSADHDDRVDPMHARKFVAQVQHVAPSGSPPAWLRISTNSGHGMGTSVSEKVEQQADYLAFLFDQLGMKLSK